MILERKEPFELGVVLSADVSDRLLNNENLRVMLFSAAENGLNMFGASEVAFPSAVELRVNEDLVKVNLRGLKNKPGTTRPADITKFLRIKPGYNNKITLGVIPDFRVGCMLNFPAVSLIMSRGHSTRKDISHSPS